MFKRRNFIGLMVAAIGFLALGATNASAQNVRYFVAASNGNFYEIREGLGTGGRFVTQSPQTVFGLRTNGYTDRASRGEIVMVLLEGTGRAEYVGFRSDNGVVNVRVNGVYLPTWAFGRVWLNPNADNVYTSIKMAGAQEVRRRLPIGTR